MCLCLKPCVLSIWIAWVWQPILAMIFSQNYEGMTSLSSTCGVTDHIILSTVHLQVIWSLDSRLTVSWNFAKICPVVGNLHCVEHSVALPKLGLYSPQPRETLSCIFFGSSFTSLCFLCCIPFKFKYWVVPYVFFFFNFSLLFSFPLFQHCANEISTTFYFYLIHKLHF